MHVGQFCKSNLCKDGTSTCHSESCNDIGDYNKVIADLSSNSISNGNITSPY